MKTIKQYICLLFLLLIVVTPAYSASEASFRKLYKTYTLNEDGSYTVITSVEINSHDGGETVKAKTLFIKNSDSDFGYNIVSSDIITGLSDI